MSAPLSQRHSGLPPALRLAIILGIALTLACGLFFILRPSATANDQSKPLGDPRLFAQQWADKTLPEGEAREVTWVGPIVKRAPGTNVTMDMHVYDKELKSTTVYRLTLDAAKVILSAERFFGDGVRGGTWKPL